MTFTGKSNLGRTGSKIVERMDRIAARRFGKKLDIEYLGKCLHNKPCDYLVEEPGESPLCEIAIDAIFNLEKCPRDKWRMVRNPFTWPERVKK